MRFVAYSSKIWSLAVLTATLVMAGVFVKFGFEHMPLWAKGCMVLLFGLALTAAVYGLASGKPAIEIDETGILCYRAYYSRIAWDDVVSARRAPRTERVRGESGQMVNQTCFSEASRPIDLEIRGLEKYANGWFASFHKPMVGLLSGGPKPSVSRLRVELTGLAASSEDAIRVIEYYLEFRQKGGSQPG